MAAFAASEGQGHPRLVEMEKVRRALPRLLCVFSCFVCGMCTTFSCIQNVLLVGSLNQSCVAERRQKAYVAHFR